MAQQSRYTDAGSRSTGARHDPQQPWTRRDFLRSGATWAGGLCLAQFAHLPPSDGPDLPIIGQGRVTIQAIGRYAEASIRSQRLGWLKRDEIVNLYALVDLPENDSATPTWYQLASGFAHRAYLQRVESAHLNTPPLARIPESGCLGEISVPFTQSYRPQRGWGWQPLYRLYFQSLHWITGKQPGPDKRTWYQLTDDLLHVNYYAPAAHVRPLDHSEITPLGLEVPPDDKRIELSIGAQRLWAYEGERLVLETPISTGVPTQEPPPGEPPTETPLGRYRIQLKMPARHMGNGELTSDIEAYELPGVPWVCVFHADGYALHGTYWHNNFGRRMSHGCVNLPNPAAHFLYRWTTPIAGPADWHRQGAGTLVVVSE